MKLKQWFETIKKSIWVYPVLYSFLATLLAAVVVLLDNGYLFDLRPYLPELFLTSGSLAKSVLGIISSAFINITTFTFSTTMVVLTIYMSEFSPRVVENFLSDERTMKSFGIFVSGFIYSILCMLFIREEFLTKPILAGTIGVIYIIFGLFNFILFINSVGKHIQASNLIDRLYDQAGEEITSYKKEISQYEHISTEELKSHMPGSPIKSEENGYIQQIDFGYLLKIAKKHDAIIRFHNVMGHFVTNQVIIGEVLSIPEDKDINQVLEEIQEGFLVGMRRTEQQDFNFTIQKIVEVALKALSPGINDPNTAIFCINNLGLLLGDLSNLKEGYVVMQDEDKPGKIFRESFDMDRILREAFLQIIHYGESDVYVMTSLLKAYRHITSEAKGVNNKIIKKHAKYLFDRLMNNISDTVEREMILDAYQEILRLEK